MNIKKTRPLPTSLEYADFIYEPTNELYYKKEENGVKQWYINGKPTGKTTIDIEPREHSVTDIHDINSQNINEQFNILNQRVNNIAQDLTYWDIYRIKTQVRENDSVLDKFAQLAPGESLVINAKQVDYNDTELHQGDVIIKTLDEEAIVIPALSEGYYYPKKITKNGANYDISYGYATVTPEDKKTNVKIDDEEEEKREVKKPTTTITFESLEDVGKNQPYNISAELTTNHYEFAARYYDNETIKPIIKFFYEDAEGREEVAVPFSLLKQGDTYIVQVSNFNSALINLIVIK